MAKKNRKESYFTGVNREIQKVVWPTRNNLAKETTVVIVTCALFSVFFWAVNSGFLAGLRLLIK